MDLYLEMVKRIPADIRKIIVEEKFIDNALNSDVTGTPMEYLFDVYEEFLDASGEHDDWGCFRCREHILSDWKKMLPYMIKLLNNAN